jgi:hypothetical protein
MIEARWPLARINRLEAAAFDAILAPGPATTPEARIVAHMAARSNADVLATLQRYAASAERSYHKNHRELLHLRQVAQRMTQKAIDNHIKNVIFAPLPPQQANGFASQPPPRAPKTGTATPSATAADCPPCS